MTKERYTITTKGSRTIVHWEGKSGEIAARASTTGSFVEKPSRDAGEGDGQKSEAETRPKNKKR